MSNIEVLDQAAATYAISGIIDKNSVACLWKKRSVLTPKEGKLVIDLGQLKHADSAGLAMLVCLQGEAIKSKHQLSFINIPSQLEQLVQLNHLEHILKA